MSKIHPSAVIHPSAELDGDVEVGPFAVIEAGARIGAGCVIQAHAVVCGHVVMGQRNTIGYGAIIGGDPQDYAFRPEVRSEVRIGDDNRIREYCTLHRGTAEGSATVVGNGCFLMAGAHLAHNVQLGNGVVLANNVLLAGHILVADKVFIGGGSVFHQHMRIGRLAICQGLSAFGKDIPPFVTAARINGVAGLNVVGLRRAGMGAAQRAEIKEAFSLLYRSGLNTSQALAEAANRSWGSEAAEFWEFCANARKRGLCDFLGPRRGGAGGETDDGAAE